MQRLHISDNDAKFDLRPTTVFDRRAFWNICTIPLADMAVSNSNSSKAESVDGDTIEVKPEPPRSADRDIEVRSNRVGALKDEPAEGASSSPLLQPLTLKMSRSSSSSTVKSRATSESSLEKKGLEECMNRSTIKMDALSAPKLGRSASQKVASITTTLVDHLPDATAEAKSSFAVMEACTYANRFLGYTEHAMECDCSEEWGE